MLYQKYLIALRYCWQGGKILSAELSVDLRLLTVVMETNMRDSTEDIAIATVRL